MMYFFLSSDNARSFRSPDKGNSLRLDAKLCRVSVFLAQFDCLVLIMILKKEIIFFVRNEKKK